MLNKFEKYMRAAEIARRLSIGKSTFWLWVKQGKLPKGIKLSNRVTVWSRSVIENFVEKQRSGGLND